MSLPILAVASNLLVLILGSCVFYSCAFYLLKHYSSIILDPDMAFSIGRTRLNYDESAKLYKARVRIKIVSNNRMGQACFDTLLLDYAKQVVAPVFDNWINGIYIAGQDTLDLKFINEALYFEAEVKFNKASISKCDEYIKMIKAINELKTIKAYYIHPSTGKQIEFSEPLLMDDYIKSLESDLNLIKSF